MYGKRVFHCRSLQIPNGSRPERPQPRQPPSDTVPLCTPPTVSLHTTHPHSDAQPRQPFLPLPHPPDHNLPPHGSFTFLTSTCGEPSQINESDSSRHTYTVDPPQQENCSSDSPPTTESLSSPPFQPQPLLLTHPDSTSSETYATHMDSEVVRSSSVDSLPRDEPPILPPSLADPAVQRELVIARDTLKHFHQLKTRKR